LIQGDKNWKLGFMLEQLTITQPDDAHLHLRDGAYLTRTVADAASQFARAIVMPNLQDPVTTLEKATQYRDRILKAIPQGQNFEPLMTLYLTDQTTPAIIKAAAACPFIYACKLYPANATTLSSAGVHDIQGLYPVFEAMQDYDLPLLVHGETADAQVDIFDREGHFLMHHLAPLIEAFPQLRLVLEHISTKAGVDFVTDAPANVAATITAHHLLMNRNHLLAGGIRPHHYCLPILKRQTDQVALMQAATSGNQKFFLGTDSAPHAQTRKESACGCAGIYTAHAAIELYLTAFEIAGALENEADVQRFNAFASGFAARFYQLPINQAVVGYRRKPWTLPDSLDFSGDTLIPLYAGEVLQWGRG
jgi:dihydroorotase